MASLTIGNKAPAFEGDCTGGGTAKLLKLKGKRVVLYFYPKDNTPGCTVEATSFSKNLADLEALGATIIGISGGDEKTKTKFCDKYNLKFYCNCIFLVFYYLRI